MPIKRLIALIALLAACSNGGSGSPLTSTGPSKTVSETAVSMADLILTAPADQSGVELLIQAAASDFPNAAELSVKNVNLKAGEGFMVMMELPSGMNRLFVATVFSSGSVVLKGEASADLPTGLSVEVPIALSDPFRPTVISTTPAGGLLGVLTSADITATFSKPVSSPGDKFSLIDADGNSIPGSADFVSEGDPKVVRFTPTSPLQSDVTYTARIDGSLADLTGRPMGQSYEWSFKTGTFAANRIARTNLTGTGGCSSCHGIGIDSGGTLHLVWTEQGSAANVTPFKNAGFSLAYRSQSSEGNLSAPVVIFNSGELRKIPSLAVSQETVAVAWRDQFSSTAGSPFGQVNAVVIDPASRSTLYVGTDGGIFKSEDGGATWSTIALPTSGTRNVLSLAIDPRAPSTLYAGTDTAGIFRSTDGGGSWTLRASGLAKTSEENITQVRSLLVDPRISTLLYAGTAAGVFKSADGGGQWSAFNQGLTNLSVNILAFDPTNPSVIYAGTDGGLFKSSDGRVWHEKNRGLSAPGSETLQVSSLAIDFVVPSVLFAGKRQGGVFKSENGGESWSFKSSGLKGPLFQFPTVNAMVFDPANHGIIYAAAGCCSDGIYRSSDGGASWIAANTGLSPAHVRALAIDPVETKTLYAGAGCCNSGLFRSTNGADTWSPILATSREILYASSNGGFSASPSPDIKNVSETSGSSDLPQLAIGPTGEAHVVWQEDVGGNAEIYYKSASAPAGVFGDPVNVSNLTSRSGAPAVVSTPSGGVLVAWDEGDGDVYSAVRSGSGFAVPKKIAQTLGGSDSVRLGVGTDGVGGERIHAVWRDESFGNSEIFYAFSDDGGSNWSSLKNLSKSPGRSALPSIAASGPNVVVAWRDGSGEIFYVRSTNGGDSFSAAVNVSDNDDFSTDPVLAFDESAVRVVWRESVTENGVRTENMDLFFGTLP